MSADRPHLFPPQTFDGFAEVQETKPIEDPRPWDVLDIVLQHSFPGAKVLDAGRGTIDKLEDLFLRGIPISRFTLVGFNGKLLGRSRESLRQSSLGIDLVRADVTGGYPFPKNYFDIVTFMMSRHNAREAHRILKKGGIAIMERAGEEDKLEAKLEFGSDSEGVRGYQSEYKKGALAAEYVSDFREAGFQDVIVKSEKWRTWYTKAELTRLLQNTPFVRNFDPMKDSGFINRVVKKYTTPRGIQLHQHRILVVARK